MVYEPKEDEFFYQCKEVTKRYDTILRQWIKASEKELPRVSVVEKDSLVKELKIKIVLVRKGLDTFTMQQKIGFFTKEISLKIPESQKTKHMYLRLVKVLHRRKPKKVVMFISLASPKQQQTLTFNEANAKGFEHVEFSFSEATRIEGKTEDVINLKIPALFEEENTIPTVYEEDNDGNLRICVGYWRYR